MGLLTVAWLDVQSKPLRTFVAIMGMIVAILAVVLVDAASSLSREANDQYIQMTWGRSATLRIASLDDGNLTASKRAVNASQLLTLLHDNGIDQVTSNGSVGIALVINGASRQIYPQWVSSTFPTVSFVEMLAGSFPKATAHSPVLHAVMSIGLANELGLDPSSAVGSVLQYVVSNGENPDLRVTPMYSLVLDGVATSIGPTSEPLDMVIVSDDPLAAPFPADPGSWTVYANDQDTALVSDTVDRVTLDATGSSAYEANRIDQRDSLSTVLDQQQTTGRIISALALAIGALGILGTGMAGVRERAREFGLRRAIGASTRDVFVSAMVQTLLEGLLAAILAVATGYIVLRLFARQLVLDRLPLPENVGLPLRSVAIGFGAALGVALLAGLLPAIRAAKASVVQALRD